MLATNGSGKMLPNTSGETTMSSSASTTDSRISLIASRPAREHLDSGDMEYRIVEAMFWIGLACWTLGQLLYRLLSGV